MLKFDLQKPNDVVAFGRATIDLYANEIGPMEEAKWAALPPTPLSPWPVWV